MADAVAKKGTANARIHIGAIAQDVIAAFEAENLDPFKYGIVCYDEWEAETEIIIDKEAEYDENGNETSPQISHEVIHPAGNLYSVRYDELLAFIIAAI